MRKLCLALMVAVLLSPGPAASAQSSNTQERVGELARESLDMLMRALDAMIDAVPQYALPEITEDGDIIIRRIRPGDDDGDENHDEDGDDDADMDET